MRANLSSWGRLTLYLLLTYRLRSVDVSIVDASRHQRGWKTAAHLHR